MQFVPPKRILMGPGPSDVSPRILEALSRPTIGHLDPSFILLMEEIKKLLQYVFQTRNELTLPVSAPGSAGMETCFVNLIEPNDTVIVCQNGVFGGRMKENVIRCGANAVMVEDDWGTAISIDKVKDAINKNPNAKALAFVHAETSTGVKSNASSLCSLANESGMLSIVDTVTGLVGIEVSVDEWGADAVYSGTQKCLSCTPGISPVTFSQKAIEVIKERKTPVQSWFLDLNLVMGYWGSNTKRAYHHTAPVNALYSLHESLLIVKEEGLKSSWERHLHNHLALKIGLESIGLSFPVKESDRLPQLNLVSIPDDIDDAKLRTYLLTKYNLEIGAGLGVLAGKVWRIGLMGHASKKENVLLCVEALEDALIMQGKNITKGMAKKTVEKYYQS